MKSSCSLCSSLLSRCRAASASAQAAPIFRFETDGFWLNLHHFLYVLGRVEAKMPDIKREAVAGAPADEAEGLKTLSDADRQAWREAVSVYANGLSKLDMVFSRPLYDVTNAVRRAPPDRRHHGGDRSRRGRRARTRRAAVSAGVVAASSRVQPRLAAIDAGPVEEVRAATARLRHARLPGAVDEGWLPGQHQRLEQLGRRVFDGGERSAAGDRHLECRQPGPARFRDHVSRSDASVGRRDRRPDA